jgi:COP9 signalosome complex subunit 1
MILNMSFTRIVQLLIEQRNYSNLTTYVFKADAALDASAAAANNNSVGAQPSSSSVPTKKKSAERENIQSKLDLAGALSYLGQGSYEKAAQAFLKIGNVKELGDWVGKVGLRCV